MWILFIMLHVGYGDQAAIPVNFPSEIACLTAIKTLKEQPRMRDDYFVCIDQTTGEASKP